MINSDNASNLYNKSEDNNIFCVCQYQGVHLFEAQLNVNLKKV